MALAAIISGAGGILSGEKTRMDTAFSGYADTSIKANRMFASLDGISFFAVNLFVIIVYTLSGYRVTAGAFHIADIAAIIEYALLALFYLMMAQVIILTLPRAFECANRVRAVLDFSPTIYDRTDKEVWFPASREDVVKFDHVAFRFADSEEYTLKNLNFSCRRGTTCPTGSIPSLRRAARTSRAGRNSAFPSPARSSKNRNVTFLTTAFPRSTSKRTPL